MRYFGVTLVILAILSFCALFMAFNSFIDISQFIVLKSAKTLDSQLGKGAGTLTIAVCVAGHARSFRHAAVRQQLQDKILSPLMRAATNTSTVTVHTFFVLRVDDDPSGKRISAQSDASAVFEGVNQFHPSMIQWISTSDEFVNITGWISRDHQHRYDRFRMPPSCAANSNGSQEYTQSQKFVRFPHTLWRARQCLDLVQESERQRGITYDWLYRVRPDVVLLNDISVPDELHPQVVYTNAVRPSLTAELHRWWGTHYPTGENPGSTNQNGSATYRAHVSDIITIASKHSMNVAMTAFEAVNDCQLYEVPTRGGISENILLYWLLAHKVPVQTLPLQWVIVRDGVGPECKRIKALSDEDIDVQMVLSRCREFARNIKSYFVKSKIAVKAVNKIRSTCG